MRIRLCVFVGCMLLVHSSHADDGKSAVAVSHAANMTAIGTPASQPPLTVRHLPAGAVDEPQGAERSTKDMPPKDTSDARRGGELRGGGNAPQPVDAGSPNDRRKNRYISFKPNNIAGQPVELEVTLTASLPHPALVGSSWWVQAPVAPGNPLLPAGECVALLGLQATAANIDWVSSGCTVLHVTGCPIEPTSDYHVRAVAGANVSAPLAVSTIFKPGPKFWGDTVGFFTGVEWTPPDGSTSIDDVVAILKTWQAGPAVAPVFNTVHLSVADLASGNINMAVNTNDILQGILAFQGNPYPYGPAGVDGGCPDDPGVDAPGGQIRFFPIRTAPLGSPPGTLGDPVAPQFNAALGCWEVIVPEGVEVDLDLQAFGWGTAAGSPALGAIQATVVSAGYDNGPASNLNPKGWPGSPGDGAYQAKLTCQVGGDGRPCTPPFDGTCNGGANGFCVSNPDWVMPPCAADLPAIARSTLDYAWGTTSQNSCASDDGLIKTMGGLILELPVGAAGTYVIDLDPDPNRTFMTSGTGTPLTGITLTPACIVTQAPLNAPQPEDSLGIPCTKNADCRIDSPTPVCLSGRCYAHKSRSLAIVPNNPGRSTVRFKVTLVDSLVRPCAAGDSWWAQAPLVPADDRPIPKLRPGECIAQLGPESTAAEIDWQAAGCQKLYLVGCPLMPTSSYAVQAVAGSVESPKSFLSTSLRPKLPKWWGDSIGDLLDPGSPWPPPDSFIDIRDVQAAILALGQRVVPPGPFPPGNVGGVHRLDAAPGDSNSVVNINDVAVLIKAFQGQPYPFGAPGADGLCFDDCNRNCIEDSLETDSNGDGIIDACDCNSNGLDDWAAFENNTDGDLIINDCDNCDVDTNPDQADSDFDGIGDCCDPDEPDTDGDGLRDVCDNCPDHRNPDQTDSDFDGIGDCCDPDELDADADGFAAVCDCDDNEPLANSGLTESIVDGNCADGIDNDCDGNTDAADPDC